MLSRMSGLLRDVVIGALFGASTGADAFFVAFRIPNLFRRMVAEGAASTAFVPVFTRYLTKEGRAGAVRAVGAVGGIAVLVLAVLTILGMVFADEVVAVFAPGFFVDASLRALTVSLTRALFPYLLLVGLAAWAMGTLHTFGSFTAPALGPVLLNLSIVSVALLFVPGFEPAVFALVVGVLLGGFLQFAVQVPGLRRQGLRLGSMFDPGHAAVAGVGRLLLPAILGGAVYQINILVATIFASLLPARSVSYLWYADRVFEFPLGIVAVAVGTAALPSLSRQARLPGREGMAESIAFGLKLVWALCLPAMVGLWLLAPQVVSVLFERGRFTAVDSASTALALRAYTVGLLAVGSARVLASVFYALEKPRFPVGAACLALFANVVFDLAFMGPTDPNADWWGAAAVAGIGEALRVTDLRHAGLALGTALAAVVNVTVLALMVVRLVPGLAGQRWARSLGIHLAASVLMAATVWGLLVIVGSAVGSYLEVALSVTVGTATYLGAALLFGSEELRVLFARRTAGPGGTN
ncbi:MAG: murein biosynthesis integral membrane protein MurJ [Candidatus Binatia bacterium]